MEWFWSHRLPLALAASRAGYTVHVAGPGADQDGGLGAYGFRGHGLPALEALPPLVAFPRAIAVLCRIMRAVKPRLVHAIGLKTALVAGPAALLQGAKRPACIYTLAGLGQLFGGQGVRIRFYRALALPMLKAIFKNKTSMLIFQNSDDKAFMENLAKLDAGRSVLVQGSGVDLNVFKPSPEPAGVPVVLLPCRLLQDKGVTVFAKAAEIIAARGLPARFVLAGGLDHFNPAALTQDDMDNLTRAYPVEWLGKVDDMPRLYAASTLVAYPSWYKEGVPKALIEAAASGRAIVTTDQPGCRDVVASGVNGLLVPVRDEHALADAIDTLLRDAALRGRYADNGRVKAQDFRLEHVVERTLAVYATALRG